MKNFITTLVCSFFVLSSFASDGFLSGLKNTTGKKDKLLVIFYKPDCPYCQGMDKQVANDLAFQEKLTENFTVQVFDITSAEGRLMADQFNVHVVPTMVNYNIPDGNFTVIKGFSGTQKLLSILGLTEPGNKIETETFQLKNKQGESSTCGDGITEAGEGCDDGNVAAGDGCNAICAIEPGFTCSGSPSVCSAVCGDGVVVAGEGCDDGNTVNNDGCNATCNIEPGYNCTGSPSVCSVATAPNDECTGAIGLSGAAGIANGQNTTATLSSNPAPSCQAVINSDVWYKFTLTATKNIHLEVNGPSIADPVLTLYRGSCVSLTEVDCDDDSGPGTYSLLEKVLDAGTYFVRVSTYDITATGTFSLVYNLSGGAVCGNGIIEDGEGCDDGNTVNGDNCSSTCQVENPATSIGVSVNTDATKAHPSAMLDVKSFNRGVLIPRMNTAQRTDITAPAKGLVVFDNTSNTFWYHNGTVWVELGGSGGAAGSGLPAGTANQTLRNNGGVWIPSNTLENNGNNITINGLLQIAAGSPGIGKVLTSDASGVGDWEKPSYDSTRNTAFWAQNSTPQAFTATFIPTLPSEIFDDGNSFGSNVFVVPATGVYRFETEAFFNFTATTALSTFRVNIETSTLTVYGSNSAIIPLGYTGFYALQGTAVMKLTAGTQIRPRILVNGTPGSQSLNSITFKGYRLY